MWEATTAYVDIALGLCCALFAILRFIETRAWQWFAIATFTIGLAMATKHLGLIVLGIAAITLWLRLWTQTGKFWRAVITTSPLLLSLLLPLPWYIRAWNASGNPVFPELYRVFGARPAGRYDAELHAAVTKLRIQAGPERNLRGYLTIPWDMTVNAESYRGTLGPVFLLTLPGLLLIRRRLPIVVLNTFVLLYFLVWAAALAFSITLPPDSDTFACCVGGCRVRQNLLIGSRYSPPLCTSCAGGRTDGCSGPELALFHYPSRRGT
jgi:4-amino-4-deoxy-L-arabinose transferase-like glycosyltransferase